MARVHVNLPQEFAFSTEIPIMIGNINRGNHLAWGAVLSILEEARVRFLTNLGFSNENIDGVSFIVVDAAVMYLKQGRYGQMLKVEVAAGEFSSKGCDMLFRISDAGTGEEMIRAKAGVLFYDYRQQKVVPVPDAFKAKLVSPP